MYLFLTITICAGFSSFYFVQRYLLPEFDHSKPSTMSDSLYVRSSPTQGKLPNQNISIYFGLVRLFSTQNSNHDDSNCQVSMRDSHFTHQSCADSGDTWTPEGETELLYSSKPVLALWWNLRCNRLCLILFVLDKFSFWSVEEGDFGIIWGNVPCLFVFCLIW